MAQEKRAIERQTGVDHTTIINWVKQIGEQLPDAPPIDKIPSVGELDELETFVGSKKTKFGCGLINCVNQRFLGAL